MPEYITKEQAIELLHYYNDEKCAAIIADVEELEPADVAPVVHAHWITAEDDDFWTCSNCRKFIHKNCAQGYCPKCGARMDGEQQCK